AGGVTRQRRYGYCRRSHREAGRQACRLRRREDRPRGQGLRRTYPRRCGRPPRAARGQVVTICRSLGEAMTIKLSGVIAAIATPINEVGSPDTGRATKLARFLLDNGCDGLNVLGTTGEATSFSLDQRKGVMDAYKAAGLPLDRLMVGTGAAAIADA